MEELRIKPTNVQPNLDNRNKTLGGCEEDTYDSEPLEMVDPLFFYFGY